MRTSGLSTRRARKRTIKISLLSSIFTEIRCWLRLHWQLHQLKSQQFYLVLAPKCTVSLKKKTVWGMPTMLTRCQSTNMAWHHLRVDHAKPATFFNPCPLGTDFWNQPQTFFFLPIATCWLLHLLRYLAMPWVEWRVTPLCTMTPLLG